jgi:hypothetical protein
VHCCEYRQLPELVPQGLNRSESKEKAAKWRPLSRGLRERNSGASTIIMKVFDWALTKIKNLAMRRGGSRPMSPSCRS